MSNRFDPVRFLTASLIVALALSACASQPPAPATETPAPAQPPAPTTAPGSNPAQMANPASVFCVDNGGKSEIRTADDGSQSGACVFPDGTECDEWAYYRGECGPVQDESAPVTSDPTGEPAADELPPAVEAAVKLVASEFSVDASAVAVKMVEDQDWPDACLGLPAPDEACAQSIVPGYKVVLTVSGQDYTVRTSQAGDVARLEK